MILLFLSLFIQIKSGFIIGQEFKNVCASQTFYQMFKDCTQLNTVNLPRTIKKINAGAFTGCINVENLSLPFLNLYLEQVL